MKELDREKVIFTIDQEGFDYAFYDYSDFSEIEDPIFHRIKKIYISASKRLKEYLGILD